MPKLTFLLNTKLCALCEARQIKKEFVFSGSGHT